VKGKRIRWLGSDHEVVIGDVYETLVGRTWATVIVTGEAPPAEWGARRFYVRREPRAAYNLVPRFHGQLRRRVTATDPPLTP
jgi:hypothetical protein